MSIDPERVWLAVEAVDMRMGAEGLSQRIQAALGKSPCDGTAYAYSNRRRTLVKLLVWDGTGVWLCPRRLHQGAFVWPRSEDPVCGLSRQQWQWLTTGVEWHRLEATAPKHWRV